MKELTIGADPEGFLFNPVTGTYVSSIGMLGGTKDYPLPVPHGAILEDNVTAEFNTEPVVWEEGFTSFSNSIVLVREHLRKTVKDRGLELHFKSVASFSEEELDSVGAQESGCDPDYNIYLGGHNSYPPINETNVRCSGGHIHIGHPAITDNPRVIGLLIKALDASIGSALILLEGVNERTLTYGALGNFRPKPYGLEYRTASNLWVDDPNIMSFVYKMVKDCVYEAIRGNDYSDRTDVLRNLIHIGDMNPSVAPEYLTNRAYEYGLSRRWW